METVVQISDLKKYFGPVKAVRGVTLEIEKGEIFGLIGPDGAGKTTLIRMLNTLLLPDSGTATVLGKDVVTDYQAIRAGLGYMPGRFSLYTDLTVEENINFFASVFGTTVDANYEIVKPIYGQLEPFKDRLAGDLSGGMKQKLALSCALIHKPRLLLLDEPTTGVDAVSRKEFWEILAFLKKEGMTILVSTPYMDEANLCDRVALMQDGLFMQVDTPQNIVASFERPLLGVKAASTYRLLKALQAYPGTHSVHPFGEYVHYTEKGGRIDQDSLRRFLSEQGLMEVGMRSIEPHIEDSFMELMRKQGHAEADL